jgi:uncharacterized membrane protein
MTAERKGLLAAAAMALGCALLFCWLSYRKFVTFAYHDWDLATYAQFFHNVLHGTFFSSIAGVHFFGVHLHLIIIALAPLYAVFPSPNTLLMVQAVALAAAAIVFYLIATREIGSIAAVVAVAVYLVHPATGFTNLNEFHPESFFPLLFFCAFHMIQTKRVGLYLVFCGACLMLKENLALPTALLGLYGALVHKNRAGWLVFGVSTLWFWLAMSVIIPTLSKGLVGVNSVYPQFGHTPAAIALNMALHPWLVLGTICTKAKLAYMLRLLLPLCFVPLVGWKVSLLAVPMALQHLASCRATESSIDYYYSVEIMPPLFIGFVYGLKQIAGWMTSESLKRAVIGAICIVSVFSGLVMGPFGPTRIVSLKNDIARKDSDQYKSRLLSQVPTDAPVVATFEFLPKLANRKELYSFHLPYAGIVLMTTNTYRLPESVSYALVDFADSHTFRWYYNPNGYSNIQNVLERNRLHVVDFTESVALFSREHKSEEWLYRVFDTDSPPAGNPLDVEIADGSKLIGYDVSDKLTGNGDMEIVLYWQCVKPVATDLSMVLDFIDPGKQLAQRSYHPVGYRILPSNSWRAGQVVQEKLRLAVSSLAPGRDYEFRIGLLNDVTCEPCKVGGKSPLDSVGRIRLCRIVLEAGSSPRMKVDRREIIPEP